MEWLAGLLGVVIGAALAGALSYSRACEKKHELELAKARAEFDSMQLEKLKAQMLSFVNTQRGARGN